MRYFKSLLMGLLILILAVIPLAGCISKSGVEIVNHHLEHSLGLPYFTSMTYVRGNVKNTGDVTLASTDVTVWVKYEVIGLQGKTFKTWGSIYLEPALFKPSEVRGFTVIVQNGTKENYDIWVSVD